MFSETADVFRSGGCFPQRRTFFGAADVFRNAGPFVGCPAPRMDRPSRIHNIPGGGSPVWDEVLDQLELLVGRLERMRLEEYLRFVQDKRRFFRVNFWAGVARGLGAAVGFTILGAALVVILQQIATRNIPLIGDFLAQLLRVVQERM